MSINSPMSAETTLAIQSLVRYEIESIQKDSIIELVKTELAKRDDLLNDYLKGAIDARMNAYSDSGIKASITLVIDEAVVDLKAKFRALQDHQQMLLQRSMPEYQLAQFNEIFKKISEIHANQKQIEIKLDNFITEKDDNNPSNAEIRRLYEYSGYHNKDVSKKFNVSPQMVSKYVNGDIQDKFIRRQLVQFFKDGIQKNSQLQLTETVTIN